MRSNQTIANFSAAPRSPPAAICCSTSKIAFAGSGTARPRFVCRHRARRAWTGLDCRAAVRGPRLRPTAR